MYRLYLRWLPVLLVAAALTASAAETVTPKAPDFGAMIAKADAAWTTLKAENVAVFYAKDAGLAFFDIVPLKYDGWPAYRDGAQKIFLDGAKSLKFVPSDDLKTTRRGNVAWSTRTVHLSAEMKEGKPLELDCRHTIIWENRGGTWLIVHEHFSTPLPG